ncbi:MAG: YqaE/Pmp3 family membrane protein [Cytophagaceae bacterium]
MKKTLLFLSFSFILSIFISTESLAEKPSGNGSATPTRDCALRPEPKISGKEKSITKTERQHQKQARHEIREKLKGVKKNRSDIDQTLLIIIAILLPPLAVYLVDGISTPFWIDVILTLLLWLPGAVYAVLRVLKLI